MYRVVIADDDIEMLKFLENIIKWNEYGFEIAGAAEDGEQALRMIREVKPDVVITDITMPLLDGLSLVRELKERKTACKIIILTCHENFDYAKEALRLDADDYIVKYTLTESDMAGLLKKTKDRLDAERKEREERIRISAQLNSGRQIMAGDFFNRILKNTDFKRETLSQRAAALNIGLPSGHYRVVCIYLDDYRANMEKAPIQDRELLKFSVLNIANELIRDRDIQEGFALAEDRYVFFYGVGPGEGSVRRSIPDKLSEVNRQLGAVLNLSSSACISGIYTDLSQFGDAVKETEHMRQSYFYQGSGGVTLEHRKFSQGKDGGFPADLETKFGNLLMTYDRELIQVCIGKVFDLLKLGNEPPDTFRQIFRKLCLAMEVELSKHGLGLEGADGRADTFQGYKALAEGLARQYSEKMAGAKQLPARNEIVEVVKYIDKCLDENITCEMMAERVNMNPSYFSKLFKTEVGLSFSEYMVNKRVERATVLLRNTAMSAEDITQSVGLANVHYFYRMYKKATGKTPGDIREQYKNPKRR
jgi:two-component system response regulator YesN